MQEYVQNDNVFMETIGDSHSIDCKWQPTISEPLRSRALEAVQMVAERLHNPDAVATITKAAMQPSAGFRTWSSSSLSCGFGSTTLLFLFLAHDFPGQGWEYAAQRHLRLAAEHTHRFPFMTPGLFGGSSGLASIVTFFAQNDKRYYRTMHNLNKHIAEQVLQGRWRKELALGVAYADYDVVSGAAGILGYLVTIEQPEDRVQEAIQKLLEYIVWLAASNKEQERKRWFLPPELYPVVLHRQQYPEGYFNCGLAHGIPGPLAALAVAWQAGHRVAGQREAMQSLVQWMIEHQLHDEWGVNWPAGVPLQQSYSSSEWSMLSPCRAAWCYGNPGIARALWLAGRALNDAAISQVAVEAIESVLRRPVVARGISSVTFCHGVAGLLATCLRFAHETSSSLVRQHIPQLVNQILSERSPQHPFVFRDLESENNWVDDPGLVTGAAGVVLVLLAASTSTEPIWDRLFLIA